MVEVAGGIIGGFFIGFLASLLANYFSPAFSRKVNRFFSRIFYLLDPYRPEIEALLKNGSTQKFVAKRYNTTEANLHNWLKQRGLGRT